MEGPSGLGHGTDQGGGSRERCSWARLSRVPGAALLSDPGIQVPCQAAGGEETPWQPTPDCNTPPPSPVPLPPLSGRLAQTARPPRVLSSGRPALGQEARPLGLLWAGPEHGPARGVSSGLDPAAHGLSTHSFLDSLSRSPTEEHLTLRPWGWGHMGHQWGRHVARPGAQRQEAEGTGCGPAAPRECPEGSGEPGLASPVISPDPCRGSVPQPQPCPEPSPLPLLSAPQQPPGVLPDRTSCPSPPPVLPPCSAPPPEQPWSLRHPTP